MRGKRKNARSFHPRHPSGLLFPTLVSEMEGNGEIEPLGPLFTNLVQQLRSQPFSDADRAGEKLLVVSDEYRINSGAEDEELVENFQVVGEESGWHYGGFEVSHADNRRHSPDQARELTTLILRCALNGGFSETEATCWRDLMTLPSEASALRTAEETAEINQRGLDLAVKLDETIQSQHGKSGPHLSVHDLQGEEKLSDFLTRLNNNPIKDATRAGERLEVHLERFQPRPDCVVNAYNICGTSGKAYATLRQTCEGLLEDWDDDEEDRRAQAEAIMIGWALNGQDTVIPAEKDKVFALLGIKNGWQCSFCEKRFPTWSLACEHEAEEHEVSEHQEADKREEN